ncbi:MAG: hypothetical protein UDG86_06650 [Lachnospiraceae bacterium]|jgi:hypothetical protein|nr:hypothetical protein [Lachnospiraceae bacterium]
MKWTEDNKEFYYLILWEGRDTSLLADERVKKRFLNTLLLIQQELPFQIYSFCMTNNRAYFLMQISKGSKAGFVFNLMAQALEQSCCSLYSGWRGEIQISSQRIEPENEAMLLEHCVMVHRHALECAARVEDYWWCSYNDYINKYHTGLVRPEKLLQQLDESARKSIQKFILCHRKLCYTKENVSGAKM